MLEQQLERIADALEKMEKHLKIIGLTMPGEIFKQPTDLSHLEDFDPTLGLPDGAVPVTTLPAEDATPEKKKRKRRTKKDSTTAVISDLGKRLKEATDKALENAPPSKLRAAAILDELPPSTTLKSAAAGGTEEVPEVTKDMVSEQIRAYVKKCGNDDKPARALLNKYQDGAKISTLDTQFYEMVYAEFERANNE